MGDPRRGDRPTPAAPSRCRHCGADLDRNARFCAECDRYQPDPPETPAEKRKVVPCRYCAELIPAGASRCNRCELFQGGFGRWLPASAATVSALGALVSVFVLLIGVFLDWERDWSKSDLQLFDYDPEYLYVRFANDGTKPSFAGKGWLKLARECDWSHKEPAFCAIPGEEPPAEALELRVLEPKRAVIAPGPSVVTFKRWSDFSHQGLSRSGIPMPQSCGDLATALAGFKICVVFEVIEYQETQPRCPGREIENLSYRNYLQFVEASACPRG